MLTVWLRDKITQIIVISLLKGTDHLEVKFMSFTYPCVISNINGFLSSEDILNIFPIFVPVQGKSGGSETTERHFPKYPYLFSIE